jgi:hypothetical protein
MAKLSMRISVLLSLFLAAFCMAPRGWPQTTMGGVSGTVRDQTGAVIPNVAIGLTNTATNAVVNTVTNEVGFYIFPSVAPGTYTLSAQSPGMQKFEGAFTVRVADRVVIDPSLTPGATATAVEVKEITPMVSTDNATVSATLERERISQLPINGRSLGNLFSQLAGVEGTRFNGIFNDATEFVLDGAVMSQRRWGGGDYPGLDSVQEFTVVSNAVSAKYSRPAEVVISMKSGTNGLHGSAFETIRNNAIGLARSRTDFYTKPPYLNRNEFGVNVGGPLIIPKVYNGKDKTFWWFGYEGRRSISYSTTNFNVPTEAMANGDFSGYKDAQGRLQTIYDPLSTGPASQGYRRTPFLGNVIPSNRETDLAKYLFSIVPRPTNSANPVVDFNWFGATRSSSPLWYTNGRMDHRFSEKDQVHASVQWTMSSTLYPTTAGGVGQPMLNGVAGLEFDSNQSMSLAPTWLHTFSPTFFNEFIIAGKRNVWFGGEVEGGNWPDRFGLPNPFNSGRWPQITGLGMGNFGYVTNDTKMNHENVFVLDDNLTKVVGKHEMQFGFHGRRDYLNILAQQRWPSPQLNFGTGATALYDAANSTPASPATTPLTGINMANMYLGYSSYQAQLAHNWFYLTDMELALYFQDNIKVTSRLTVNVGLRWERWSPYHEKNGTNIGFSPKDHAVVLSSSLDSLYKYNYTVPGLVQQFQNMGIRFETYQQAGLPQDQYYARSKNFGPRAGFAYKALSGKSSFVLRGGYSVGYFNGDLYEWQDNVRSNFPLAATFSYDLNNAAQSPDGIGNYWLRSAPQVVNGVNSSGVLSLAAASGITPGCCGIFYFNPQQPDARTHSWNLTVEKEVMNNTVARVRYLGNHTNNLFQQYSINDAIPSYVWYKTKGTPLPTGTTSNIARRLYDSTSGYGGLTTYMLTGWNNNQGLELEMERRFAKGLAFHISYDLLNAFASTSCNSGCAIGTAVLRDPGYYLPDAVPADYDARNRYLNYQRATDVPKHRLKWNFLIDLPVGKGKKLLGNANNVLDKFVGGWQLAGSGSLRSTWFALPTGNWNFTGEPVHNYGYKYPIQNCTSGVCVPGYLWWNGYIPANKINSHDANGNPNGYMGIPADYKPAVTPLIPWGSTAMPANAPAGTNVSTYWDTNTVWVPLKDGTTVRTTDFTGVLNPFQNQWRPGVLQWGQDASLFKVIAIKESVRLRINADVFNVFNHPGNPNSVGSDGMESTRSSGNSPRTLQLSLRLSF